MKKLLSLLTMGFILISSTPAYTASQNDMRLYVEKKTVASDKQAYHGAKFEPKVGLI